MGDVKSKKIKGKGDEEVSQQEDVEELGDEYSCSKEAHGEEDVEMLGHVEGEGQLKGGYTQKRK